MKAIKRVVLSLFFLIWSSSIVITSGSILKGLDLKMSSSFSTDTSLVNKYIRLAFNSDSKKTDLVFIKLNLDSAEMICRKESIEIPSLLHLARAKFFFLSQDFNNASQEANLALALSEKNREVVTAAKTLIFLSQYSLRTGFFKESIDYSNNCIALAKKEHLRGFKQIGYGAQANVYYAIGNTKEYNKGLQKLIEASKEDKDTSHLLTGYYLLGTSLTGENRNYRKADSLEFQDYKVPDSLVFRDFKNQS